MAAPDGGIAVFVLVYMGTTTRLNRREQVKIEEDGGPCSLSRVNRWINQPSPAAVDPQVPHLPSRRTFGGRSGKLRPFDKLPPQ